MIDFSDFKSAKSVFSFFLEISKIPRGSGNTAAIANYLVSFAKERGLEYIRDAKDNVIIKKSATEGYEGLPGIIFQGHTDIVAVKTPESSIDLEKEGLEVYRDGDFLRARSTSLGGDDGVAVAYALAILDSNDIPHPDFEAIFTSDEEIGLLGAAALDGSAVSGKRMINIDSDDEGVFTVGCAGGLKADVILPVQFEAASGTPYCLDIRGLLGGHSGVDIDKGRANAIELLFEMLACLDDIRLVEISGGAADNAIPAFAQAIFIGDGTAVERINASRTALLEKWSKTEADMSITLTECECKNIAMSRESTERLIKLALDEPNGIISMSEDIEGLVQTSLNLGIIRTNNDSVDMGFAIRSSKNSDNDSLTNLLAQKAQPYGATVTATGKYPAWEYRKASHLREKMCKIYEKMYGSSPKVITIHAGLECGIFQDKIGDLDCVSLGPDNFDIHTTNEHLSISSTARVYDFLLEVLKDKEL